LARHSSRPYLQQRLTTRAASKDGQTEDKPKVNIVQEAFSDFTSGDKPMSTKSVLGDDTYSRISLAVGADAFAKIESVLDKVLANRRAITLASAVLDVMLILAGIKAFQQFNSS
jgi:hypothetical protein